MSTLTNPETGEIYELQTAKGLSYPLSKSDTRSVQVRLTLPNRTEELSAGDSAGTADFYLKGHKLKSIDLVCVPAGNADATSADASNTDDTSADAA